MNDRQPSRVVVGGVIFHGGKVLILKRHRDERMYPGLWELPSGKVEVGESLEQALMREVKEETGLDITLRARISEFSYETRDGSNARKTLQVNFLVEPLNSSVEISKEHETFAWITKTQIDKFDISAQTKEVIQKGLNVYANLANGRSTHQT